MPFINYLKYVRIKKNMLQKDLAALINRKPITLRKYEQALLPIPKDIAKQLASILDQDPTLLQGYVKSIYVTTEEYHTLLPNHPVRLSSRKTPSRIFDMLNLHKRTISLKDCHAIVLRRRP